MTAEKSGASAPRDAPPQSWGNRHRMDEPGQPDLPAGVLITDR